MIRNVKSPITKRFLMAILPDRVIYELNWRAELKAFEKRTKLAKKDEYDAENI